MPRRRSTPPTDGPSVLSRRRALGLLGAGLGTALAAGPALAACAPVPGEPAEPDLTERVLGLTRDLSPSMSYREPTRRESAALVPALLTLSAAPTDRDAREALERHGFTIDLATDGAGVRRVVAVAESDGERAWGLYAFPVEGPPSALVEVPHPVADRHTERVGLELVDRLPGAALAVAGAHRRADASRADVAHETGSLFHGLSSRLAAQRRVPQLQLHGFDDAGHDTDGEVVLSPGAAAVTPLIEAAARQLADAGRDVCRVWLDDCPDLAGRTNVQGIAARDDGLPFLHVELAEALRSERGERAALATALGLAAR